MRSHLSTTRTIPIMVLLAAAIVLAGATTPTAAQQVPRLELKPATATHPQELTWASSLRELSDGRVIVTDGREQRMFVLDFATGEAAEFGRKGRGPNEYSMLSFLYATGVDSSIMSDFMGRRWLLLDGARIAETVPSDDPAVAAVESAIHGADALGHVMLRKGPPRSDGVTVTGIEDSSAIVLVERATGRADTIAMLRNNPTRHEQRTNAEGKVTFMSFMPAGVLTSREDAVLFSDGTLAVARLEPFRVDWRSPTGAWANGAPLDVPRIRVDARERRAFLERNADAYRPPTTPSPFPAPKPPSDDDFPEYFPPFPLSASIKPGPAGTLIVRRSKSADSMTPHYFVVDRSGRLLGEISLAANEEILGAGERTLYIGFKDEDDIQRIRRHPWP